MEPGTPQANKGHLRAPTIAKGVPREVKSLRTTRGGNARNWNQPGPYSLKRDKATIGSWLGIGE